MVYKNNIPQPTDLLDESQPELLENFSQLDTAFDVDHYPFSNTTADQGKHNQVTTPAITGTPAVAPTTAADEPKFYGLKESEPTSTIPFGALHYSRGPSDALPTPITSLHGGPVNLAVDAKENIVDFADMSRSICTLYFYDTVVLYTRCYMVVYTGTVVRTRPLDGSVGLDVIGSGTIVQIQNKSGSAVSNLYWTLDIKRLEV